MNYIEKVREFHQTFEHPVGNLEQPEPLKIRQLRIKLLFEELKELAVASDCQGTFSQLCYSEGLRSDIMPTQEFDGDNVDKVEELDALCDIQYVLSGKILTSGLHEVFDRNFELVHQNNMRKAHQTEAHAIATAYSKGWKPGQYTIIEKEGGYLLLDSNGKLTKPHDHRKVKLHL